MLEWEEATEWGVMRILGSGSYQYKGSLVKTTQRVWETEKGSVAEVLIVGTGRVIMV